MSPPAYHITESTVTDEEGYHNEVVPLILKSLEDFGGKPIVRGGKTVSVSGSPPAGRITVVQFESLDKAQAWINSPAIQAALPIVQKYSTNIRAYQIEGASP